MAKNNKNNGGGFDIISMKRLSELAKVSYRRIYDVLVVNKYDSLTDNENTQIANALFGELKRVFKVLGFKITMERL